MAKKKNKGNIFTRFGVYVSKKIGMGKVERRLYTGNSYSARLNEQVRRETSKKLTFFDLFRSKAKLSKKGKDIYSGYRKRFNLSPEDFAKLDKKELKTLQGHRKSIVLKRLHKFFGDAIGIMPKTVQNIVAPHFSKFNSTVGSTFRKSARQIYRSEHLRQLKINADDNIARQLAMVKVGLHRNKLLKSAFIAGGKDALRLAVIGYVGYRAQKSVRKVVHGLLSKAEKGRRISKGQLASAKFKNRKRKK